MSKVTYDFASTNDAEQAYNGVYLVVSYDEERVVVSAEGTSQRLARVDTPFAPVAIYERDGSEGRYVEVGSDTLLSSIVQTYPMRQFVNAHGTCWHIEMSSRRQYRKALPVSTSAVDMAAGNGMRIDPVIAAEAFLGGSQIHSLSQFMSSGASAAHISGTSLVIVRRNMNIFWMGQKVGRLSNGETLVDAEISDAIRVKVISEMQRAFDREGV